MTIRIMTKRLWHGMQQCKFCGGRLVLDHGEWYHFDLADVDETGRACAQSDSEYHEDAEAEPASPPPDEIWVLDTQAKYRYYRTKSSLLAYIANETSRMGYHSNPSRKIESATLWYCDVTGPGVASGNQLRWVLIPQELWMNGKLSDGD